MQKITKLWFVLLLFNIFLNLNATQDWFDKTESQQPTQEVCGQPDIQTPNNGPKNNGFVSFVQSFSTLTNTQKINGASIHSFKNAQSELKHKYLVNNESTSVNLKSLFVSLMRRGPPILT